MKQLPNGWRRVELSELATIKYGKAKPKTDGIIPVIGSGGAYAVAGESLVDFPTVVVGRKGTAGTVWLQEKPCWPSDTAFYLDWLSDNKDNLHRFVFYHFQARPIATEHARTTIPSLPRPDLENYILYLPPENERSAIVSILRSVQSSKNARTAETQIERERKAALMAHLFSHGTRGVAAIETPIGRLPCNWKVVKLVNAYDFTNKPRQVRVADFDQIAFIPMEMIPIGGTNFEQFLLKQPNELTSGTYFESGDILVAKITPSFENSKQGIAPDVPNGFGYATTEVIPIRGIDETSDKWFLSFYLLQQSIRIELAAKMEGSTGRQRLGKNAIADLLIPLPPLDEQQEIAAILRACDDKIAALEEEATRLEELFRAMLEELMSGRISVAALLETTTSPVW